MSEDKPAETVEEKVEELAEAMPKTEETNQDDNLTELINKNKLMEEQLIKQEQLKAKLMVDGRGEAGQQPQTEQEKADAEAKEILSKFQ